ncbi:MAG: aldehyde dehydrogenase family protein [Tannerella sp.]|jgi:aldehyde dehydrogenase (NAD+)|nr:aldehyde dehydrogenase family protein [Tannerella sp.]
MYQIINKQRDFFSSGVTKNIEFRKQQLTRLRQVIVEKHASIERALFADLHKCEFEAFATETSAIIDEITCAIDNLDEWVKPVEKPAPPVFGQTRSEIIYEPYGIVLILNTWNYPFVLGFKQLVGVLAAGNCCVLKPSEIAPECSKVISDIISAAFAPEYCTVIEGNADTAAALMRERFDFVAYTGSIATGRLVAVAAAENLTPCMLELGGKSPCIIDKSADIERSVASICWGKFINAGQTCTAPDHVWVHKSIKNQFVEAVIAQIKKFYGEDASNSNDYGRIVNLRHFNRLKALMNDGNIVYGGQTDENDLFIAPTVIDSITLDSPVMQEEVFGPLMPILEYERLDDVINTLSKREKPLALYLYTTEQSTEDMVINGLSFGGGCVNTTLMHMINNNLPFGGIGASGYGNYEGRWSVETFSHKKSILRRTLSDDPPPLFPPYGEGARFLKTYYNINK